LNQDKSAAYKNLAGGPTVLGDLDSNDLQVHIQ
jgi:hypothetical protein